MTPVVIPIVVPSCRPLRLSFQTKNKAALEDGTKLTVEFQKGDLKYLINVFLTLAVSFNVLELTMSTQRGDNN